MIESDFSVEAVRDHYDRLSSFYRMLWGEHIHHGYWEDGESSQQAQVKLIERLALHAGIARGSRVLDVGCGIGGSSLWLAENLQCSVLGLTISPVQANMATAKARAVRLESRASFEVMDARALPFEGASFDVVWVIECSEHLPDKAGFIESCARVLKPGGVLALCAWLRADPHARPEHATLVEEVCRGMLCPHLASHREYSTWMMDSGFSSVHAEDVTSRVERTWERCAALVRRPEIQAALKVSGERVRRFVQAFPAMSQAYAERAMSYGMFVARKKEHGGPTLSAIDV
jgi:tocopherol O-methyltransferase